MSNEQRLKQDIESLQEQWNLLADKLQRFERKKILAITAEEGFSLDHQIIDIKKERDAVEQKLAALEAEYRKQVMTPTAEQQADLDRQMERLREKQRRDDQMRQTSQRKSVGAKPYVEKLFVDRVAYLEQLTRFVCCDDARVIVIVGQGGIGKTALAAKFCDDIEKAGYRLNRFLAEKDAHPTRSHALRGNDDAGRSASSAAERQEERSHAERGNEGMISFPIRAIVYVSKTEMAAFTMEQVFAKLLHTLDADAAARLEPVIKDPKATTAFKTERLLEEFQTEPTLLILDNFETALRETAITHGDLETFLHTVCAAQHRLTVLITSRYKVNIKAFAVRQQIELNEGLQIEDAVDFLRRLAPDVPQIQQASDAELTQLARKVHGVPMALRSIAGFLTERKQRRLTVAHLLKDDARFQDFRQHDFKEGLRKLLDEQYRILPEDAQLALQAMAVFNAPVTPTAVQYLLPGLDAESALDALAYDYFLAQRNPITNQFELHPTVQEFAYHQISEEPTPARHMFPSTLFPSTSSGNGGFSFPELVEGNRAALHARAADFYAELKKPQAAWKSLPDLRPHLDEIQQRIYAGDYDRAARVLTEIDFNYLQLWGYSRLIIELREQLIGKLNDEYLDETNYGYLGLTYWNIGRLKEAISLYEKALEIARNMKDKWGEGAWLGNLGIAYRGLGQFDRAIDHYTQALAIAREIGDKRGEGNALGNLGIAYRGLGQFDRVIDHYTQVLAIDQEIGDKSGEGIDTGNLGEAYFERCIQQGTDADLPQAIAAHQRALTISEEIKYPITICNNLRRLGLDYLFACDVAQATAYFHRCLEACEQALAQSPLSTIFYRRAFALLALACIEHASESPALAAYREAIAANAAAGVLQEQIHELERFQHILPRTPCNSAAANAAIRAALALLRQT